MHSGGILSCRVTYASWSGCQNRVLANGICVTGRTRSLMKTAKMTSLQSTPPKKQAPLLIRPQKTTKMTPMGGVVLPQKHGLPKKGFCIPDIGCALNDWLPSAMCGRCNP